MKMFRQTVLIFVLAGGVVACRQPSLKQSASPDPAQLPLEDSAIVMTAETDEEYERRVEALARYATGVSYEASNEPERALEEFYRSALADPSDEAFVLDTSRRLLNNRQTEKAIELLQLASTRPESTGLVHALLGRAHLLAGNTNEAIAANVAAIRISPTSITGYQNLAEIHFEAGRVEDAVKVLEQAARQKKVDAGYLINIAETYTRQIQLKPSLMETLKPRAVAILKRASEMNISNTGLQQRLADTFAMLGERSTAARIYEDLLTKYEDFPILRDPIREKLANNYLLDGDAVRAEEQLELLVRGNATGYPQAYYLLGTIAFEAKNFERAAEYFNRTILIVPDLEQAYYDLAAAHLNANKGGEALAVLDRARERFRESFIGEFYSALALQQQKRYGDAIRHLTTAEVIAKATDPKRLDHRFYFQLGACHERNRDYESAAKAFRQALALNPEDADALNYLGYMWAEQGINLEEARVLIERALKIEPENSAYLDSMGWVLFKLNQPEEALSYLLRAAERAERPDATIYEHIGDVYFSLKQLERAREAWEKSIAIEPNDGVKKKVGSSL